LESLQKAFSHGLVVASRIGYQVFQTVILNALFIIDEKHLEMAIEQDVDLLPLLMIYAPQWIQPTKQLVGRMGGGYENRITLENSLKWLDEQCQKRHRGYYDIIVNLPKTDPKVEGSNPLPTTTTAPGVTSPTAATDASKKSQPKVYPPPGADAKRVEWWWGNVQRLTRFIFRGEVPTSSKKWGIEHLKWRAQQEAEGAKNVDQLLAKAEQTVQERKEGEKH
jgi:hypothetical protein